MPKLKKLILISNSFSFILDYKIPLIECALKKDKNSKIIVMVPDKNHKDYQNEAYKKYEKIMKKNKTLMNIKRGSKIFAIFRNIFEITKFIYSCKSNEEIYIVSHTATINLSLLLSSIFNFKFRNIFFIYVITGFGPSKIRKGIRSRLIGRVYINSMQIASSLKKHRVITLNKQDRDIIQDFNPSRKVFLVRESGISKETFLKYKEISKPELKKIKIVYVGRFLLEKGINDLEIISSYLKLSGIVHTFIAYGSKDNFNSSCVGNPYSKKSPIENNVIFNPAMPYEEIFRDANIAIFPSLREGHPKLVPLAMLFKCIPIASPNPGLDVDIIDGFNGLLASTSSPSSIAAEIVKLYTNPNLYEKILKGCETYVENLSEFPLNEEFLKNIFFKE